MASNNTVTITFRLNGDNAGLKDLAKNTDGFKKAIQGTISEAKNLKTAVNFTALATGINSAERAVNQLQSAMQGLSEAYAAQEAAEKRLETVMRERMNATDSEIQSIKDLAVAQQQLGVIGDEVQLQGAQQIATFLTQKDAIVTLLPAMNDLLAQQKGLSATGNDAVSVANMLGKAMTGQTSALRRVGITFNEADEAAMKYGTEQERAAALARVITANVGHMNAELAKTPSGQMQQLKNKLGDVREQLGKVASGVMPFVTIAAQVLSAVGSVAMLTASMRAMNTTLLASSKAFFASTVAASKHAIAVALTGKTTVSTTAITRVFSAALKGTAYSAVAAKLAIKGLLISTGVGIAIVALTTALEALISAMGKASGEAEETKTLSDRLKDAHNAEAQALDTHRAALEADMAKLKSFNGTKEQEKKIVRELNERYGQTMGYFKSVSEWYDALKKNSKAYCQQMVIEARTRALANMIAEEQRKKDDILYKPDGSRRMYSTKRPEKEVWQSAGGAGSYKSVEYGQSDWDKANAQMAAADKRIAHLQNLLNKAADDASKITFDAIGSPTAPDLDDNNINTPTAAPKEIAETTAMGSLDWFEKQISRYRSLISGATDEGLIQGYKEWLDYLESSAKTLKIKYGLEPVPESPAPEEFMTGDDLKRSNYSDAQDRVNSIKTDYEIGLIDADEAQAQLDAINAALQAIGLNPITIELDSSDVDFTAKKFDTLWGAVQQSGAALQGLGDALGTPELNIAGTLAQAIATMALSYSQALASSAKLSPIAWTAFGAAGLAQLTAIISTVKSVGKFAEGGIISGPTLGLMGEYAGARNNPEVVAPLSKLRSMIETTGGGGNYSFRIQGRDLVGVLANETRSSGRKTNIRI